MMSPSRFTIALTLITAIVTIAVTPAVDAFATKAVVSPTRAAQSTALNVFGKKEPVEDLSFIETRDMTREEMLELNKKNEDIMNMELQAMTGFSLVLSLPILYLCWVAFFSD
jgi:selenocysteine-specific elongation factor